jgi:hypothetical protein
VRYQSHYVSVHMYLCSINHIIHTCAVSTTPSTLCSINHIIHTYVVSTIPCTLCSINYIICTVQYRLCTGSALSVCSINHTIYTVHCAQSITLPPYYAYQIHYLHNAVSSTPSTLSSITYSSIDCTIHRSTMFSINFNHYPHFGYQYTMHDVHDTYVYNYSIHKVQYNLHIYTVELQISIQSTLRSFHYVINTVQ